VVKIRRQRFKYGAACVESIIQEEVFKGTNIGVRKWQLYS
jgi:hypothetical protein